MMYKAPSQEEPYESELSVEEIQMAPATRKPKSVQTPKKVQFHHGHHLASKPPRKVQRPSVSFFCLEMKEELANSMLKKYS